MRKFVFLAVAISLVAQDGFPKPTRWKNNYFKRMFLLDPYFDAVR
jgi:hypothetical protein